MPAFLFRMKPLPKAEYELMKEMIAKYELSEGSLDGPSELYTILLRLAYEVCKQYNGNGEAWLAQVVKTWREYPDEVRSYELEK